MNEIIGRVAATEKFPATMDKFYFWTDADFRLNAFDVVKVEHIGGSHTFGTVENIFHITDVKSFPINYISCDFGDTTIAAPTLRVAMNCVEVAVSFNSKNIYTPVKNDSSVTLATAAEIEMASDLDKIKNKLPCGFLKMYEGHGDKEIIFPVSLDAQFIIGFESAHLNISGISGLAAKTNFKIIGYRMEVNGEPLVKPYKINIETRNGEDGIFDLDFRDFKDAEENLKLPDKIKEELAK